MSSGGISVPRARTSAPGFLARELCYQSRLISESVSESVLAGVRAELVCADAFVCVCERERESIYILYIYKVYIINIIYII